MDKSANCLLVRVGWLAGGGAYLGALDGGDEACGEGEVPELLPHVLDGCVHDSADLDLGGHGWWWCCVGVLFACGPGRRTSDCAPPRGLPKNKKGGTAAPRHSRLAAPKTAPQPRRERTSTAVHTYFLVGTHQLSAKPPPPPTAIVASTRTRIVVRVIVFVCVYVCTKLGSVYDHCTAVGRDGEVGEGEEEEEGAAPAARRSSSSRARVA